MRIKRVTYTDEHGWKRCSLVRESDGESEGKYGIPIGPPDLGRLNWDDIAKEINNTLVDMGVVDWPAFQANPQGVTSAMNAVKRAIHNLYRQEYNDKMEK